MTFSARNYSKFNSRRKIFLSILGVIIAVLIVSAALVRAAYQDNLKPLSSEDKSIVVTIEPGSAPSQIADTLKTKNVIKSDWAFEWYVRNHNLRSQLKAGTYIFKPSQSVEEIVSKIIDGKVASNLVTILPGKRLDQIKAGFIKDGFTQEQVDKALDPKNYPNHPALVDKPDGASLEGYLYPESFQKTAETTLEQIVKQSLDEMARYLTANLRQDFSEQGLSVHQGIIIASIVEQEVSKTQDKPVVAQVFLKRHKMGMPLGADPTALYGAIAAGAQPSVTYDSPYNTRLHAGLPPGPIGNVSEASMKAVANPAQTDWLYFVAGDDGVTYYSNNLQEHEELTRQHCKELCKSY